LFGRKEKSLKITAGKKLENYSCKNIEKQKKIQKCKVKEILLNHSINN